MVVSLFYLALCRLLGLVRSLRRSELDKDIELMVLRHEVHILGVTEHPTAAFVARVAATSLGDAPITCQPLFWVRE